MFEGFLANAGNLLAGMGGYIDPNLLTAFNAQNAATGGSGALNNTGAQAAKVANAKNALDGVDLEAMLKRGLEQTGTTDQMASLEKQLADGISTAQWQQAGASIAPNLLSGIKTGLSKTEEQRDLWEQAKTKLPTYVLGR